jgi:hypothetical protein
LRHYTTSRNVAGSILDEFIVLLAALGSTQPLTGSTRNPPGGKRRPALEADNLTAIFEPIVYKMWEPRRPVNNDRDFLIFLGASWKYATELIGVMDNAAFSCVQRKVTSP